MIRARDPATMSPAERVAEVGQLLAAGFQRLFATEIKATQLAGSGDRVPQDCLDQVAATEAQCGSPMEATR